MNIVDRRLNPKAKSLGNRQRFIKRAKADIKEAVKDAIKNRNVSDGSQGGVKVRTKSVAEPTLSPDYSTGDRDFVLPGNREYVVGDTILRPQKEGAGGAGGGAGTDTAEDDFEFILSKDEFLNVFFDELQLPDMVKKSLKNTKNFSYVRAGFTPEGPPSRLNPVRTMRKSLGRRISLGRPTQEELEALEKAILDAQDHGEEELLIELRERYERLVSKRNSVPFIDPLDLQYSRLDRVQKPITQAVMFCLMDVSSSMHENLKIMAKKFFILLHIFLNRNYKNLEVVFIRHTTEAKAVSEDEFFKSTESGGTLVSSCLQEMKKQIQTKYDPADWNIYAAQASDGDNLPDDGQVCIDLMNKDILPVTQYFAYIEVNERNPYSSGLSFENTSYLWKAYDQLKADNFDMKKVESPSDIYSVFHNLFSKDRE